MLVDSHKKKNHENNNRKHRFLIVVNVLGSAGPLKYVVNGDDSVAEVINTALRLYAREGRLPVLGSDVNRCLLYPANAGSDALNPYKMIAACRGRYFLLCKKQSHPHMLELRSEMIAQKKSRCWKGMAQHILHYFKDLI